MERDVHVRGLPHAFGILTDIDAGQFAKHVVLQAVILRGARDHFDAAFFVDHEAHEHIAGQIALRENGESQMLAEGPVELALHGGASSSGNVRSQWLGGTGVVQGEHACEDKQGAGDGGFHGGVLLLVFEHGTAGHPSELQVQRVIVMSGTCTVMSGGNSHEHRQPGLGGSRDLCIASDASLPQCLSSSERG